ncbi:hypothetical protein [Paraburkholderia sp. 35.1]|uniref:hypothetical protein n=1 Tax=Paraburkholderia sp. 35.1 TaxID=2991058 RepID=UPI003D1A4324
MGWITGCGVGRGGGGVGVGFGISCFGCALGGAGGGSSFFTSGGGGGGGGGAICTRISFGGGGGGGWNFMCDTPRITTRLDHHRNADRQLHGHATVMRRRRRCPECTVQAVLRIFHVDGR